jgi:two-component system chemotaxis response regulator CheY
LQNVLLFKIVKNFKELKLMALDLSMKILVVDDFSTMRRIVKNILKQIGFSDIDEAENGQVALSKLNDNSYDLVVSDWNMPEMTGIELLKAVRATDGIKDIPFLMVTAEAKKENVVEAVKAGVNNYIVKPFTAEVLQEKIEKIFPD